MGLEIRTTPALIGIERTPSRLEMHAESATVSLHSTQPQLRIHTEPTRVLIDQHDAFASTGLKNSLEATKEAAQRGQQQVLEGIQRKVEDGNRLAAIETGENAIAAIAAKNAWPEHEFGIDCIPKVGPKFDVTGGIEFDTNWDDVGVHNGIEAEYTPGSLNMHYELAQLNIGLKQYGSVDINYVGNNVDISI